MSKFNVMRSVGKVRYLVSFSDGSKSRRDGSEFYDIRSFSNKLKLNKFIKSLINQGFIQSN